MTRLLACMFTLTLAVGADVLEASCSDAGTCVEEQEGDEYAAMNMEMLQSRTQKHRETAPKHRAGSSPKAPESAAAAEEQRERESAAAVEKQRERDNVDRRAEFVSFDSNGKVCLLCGKPFPDRVDREYKEFRTDCGELSSPNGPNSSAFLDVPVVELSQMNEQTKAVERNGFCQLNYAKSCVDAVANKDYLYWAKSLNLNSSVARVNAAWDGRYCKINGFLESGIVALQHDFEKTQAKAKELCNTKYAKHNIEKLTFAHMAKAARYDDPTAPTVDEAELLAAWNCAMGELGCDLALCAYSFCKKDGSSTGLYDECEGWDPIKGMPHKI